MTIINIFVFLIPFMLVFSVKPEDSKKKKGASLICAILFYWVALALAAYIRYKVLLEINANDENRTNILDVPAFTQYAKFWWNFTALGWLYGIAITSAAELLWRLKHKKRMKALGKRYSIMWFVLMLLGLPLAVFVLPAYFMFFVLSFVKVFIYCDQPEMQPYYSFTEAIVCRLSNSL